MHDFLCPASVDLPGDRIRMSRKPSSSPPETADLKNIMALSTCPAAAMHLSQKNHLCLPPSAVRANGEIIVPQTALVLVVPLAGSLRVVLALEGWLEATNLEVIHDAVSVLSLDLWNAWDNSTTIDRAIYYLSRLRRSSWF